MPHCLLAYRYECNHDGPVGARAGTATAGGCCSSAIGRWRRMPHIEAQLRSLPATLHGNLVCDWTQALAPGISPAWALLRRLAEAAPAARSQPRGGIRRIFWICCKNSIVERHAALAAAWPPRRWNDWSANWDAGRFCKGVHARGVIVFLGRIATVIGEAFSRPRAMANLVGGAAYLRNRHHRHSDRRADRISHQRDRGIPRRAATVALRRRYFRRRSGDHRDFCARWECC